MPVASSSSKRPTPASPGSQSCFERPGAGHISVVAVRPRFRRHGAASAQICRAARYLRSIGLDTIRIDAYLGARTAVEAYRSLGFDVYDMVEDPDADPRGANEE